MSLDRLRESSDYIEGILNIQKSESDNIGIKYAPITVEDSVSIASSFQFG